MAVGRSVKPYLRALEAFGNEGAVSDVDGPQILGRWKGQADDGTAVETLEHLPSSGWDPGEALLSEWDRTDRLGQLHRHKVPRHSLLPRRKVRA